MTPELTKILRCVDCNGTSLAVNATETDDGDVVTGQLSCTDCGATYRIEEGIAICLPAAMRKVDEDQRKRWFDKREQIERELIDEDQETYKSRFRDAARAEGLDESTDGYLWEVRLYEHTVADFGEHWEQMPERFGISWQREESGEKDRDDRALKHLLGREGSLEGRLVLDAGSGADVYLVRRLQQAGATVVCCDIVPGMIKHLRRAHELRRKTEGGARFQGVCGDLSCLPFRDDVFDHVCCWECIHHVQPIDRATREVARITKPGGAPYVLEVNDQHVFTYPGKIFPRFLKRVIRRGIRRLFGTERRYLEGSPYEQITPISAFAASLERSGFRDVGMSVVVHSPGVFPAFVTRAWEWLAKRLPRVFDPVAMEFILWGKKPASALRS
ncbi:MAG: methyltransferase domain-containing protein [bacterium]